MILSARYQLFRFSDPTVRFILDAKMINMGCNIATFSVLRETETVVSTAIRARCRVAFSLSDVDATISWNDMKLDQN